MISKETCCTNCSHQPVCSFKDDFMKAQKAVDGISVTLGETEKGIEMKDLCKFDFILPIILQCKYYEPSKQAIKRMINKADIATDTYDSL